MELDLLRRGTLSPVMNWKVREVADLGVSSLYLLVVSKYSWRMVEVSRQSVRGLDFS